MTVQARLAIVLQVLVGAILLWLALTRDPAPPEVIPAERRVPVAYVTATPRDYAPKVSGYGTVAPARVWTAMAEVSGRVAALHSGFVRGGFVGKGEVLVRIAADEYEIALERAEADLDAAEAHLAEMRASVHTTTLSLMIEEDALALAEIDLARTERLAKSGTVSATVVDDRRREVLTQRSKVQTQRNTLTLLPSQIAALDASAAASRAARDAAALDLVRTVIRAPFDARVARSDIEISQYVGAGTEMGALDGVDAAEIDVQVPQNRMAALARLVAADPALADRTGSGPTTPAGHGRLRRTSMDDPHGIEGQHGQPLSARVHLNLGTTEAEWSAKVARLSDTVSTETRSVGVIVRVDAPYAGTHSSRGQPLVKGTFVRVDLTAPPLTGMTLLPRAAIRDGRVMLVGPENRLVYASAVPAFVDDGIAVLAPGTLPTDARVVTGPLSPAIEGLLLAPAPDLATDARLSAAAVGPDL